MFVLRVWDSCVKIEFHQVMTTYETRQTVEKREKRRSTRHLAVRSLQDLTASAFLFLSLDTRVILLLCIQHFLLFKCLFKVLFYQVFFEISYIITRLPLSQDSFRIYSYFRKLYITPVLILSYFIYFIARQRLQLRENKLIG